MASANKSGYSVLAKPLRSRCSAIQQCLESFEVRFTMLMKSPSPFPQGFDSGKYPFLVFALILEALDGFLR